MGIAAPSPSSEIPESRLRRIVNEANQRSLIINYDENAFIRGLVASGVTVELQQNGLSRNLEAITFPMGQSIRYRYDNPVFPSHLTGVDDENGDSFATYEYGDAGLVKTSSHAGNSNRWEFEYLGIDGVKQSVTEHDPLGSSRVWTFHRTKRDASYTDWQSPDLSQPAGSGCIESASSLVHDNWGRVVRRLDFVGNLSCHGYASDRNVETVRIEGLASADGPVCDGDLGTYQVDPRALLETSVTRVAPDRRTWRP
jgi:hypothetical protein